jgi:hypothetical protein
MLKMAQQEYIKFLHEAEGCTVSEIARQVGVHWRTAKRYADKDNWNKPLGKRKSSSPVMGPYMEIVDAWLEEDQLLPRKQRVFYQYHDNIPEVRIVNPGFSFPGEGSGIGVSLTWSKASILLTVTYKVESLSARKDHLFFLNREKKWNAN